VRDLQRPNEGIRRSARHALRAALLGAVAAVGFAAASIPLSSIFAAYDIAIPSGLQGVLICTPFFVWVLATPNGGDACLRHLALRIVLWRAGHASWNYAAFLNAMSDRLVLRRVGGSYTFWHLQLRDYFAELSAEQIDALAESAPPRDVQRPTA
jgi:hypothetical protein